MIAIYHRVYRRENFEKAAQDLFGLLYTAQSKQPEQPRALYVDIDGHRNEAGGFDDDMLELQQEFGLHMLLPFVKELHFPLFSVENPHEQKNDVPEKIMIQNPRNERDNSLEKLYIENYSNTEYVSEDEVYKYMEHLSTFLKDYKNNVYIHREKEAYDLFGYMLMWHNHIIDLTIELFNTFVHGNLLSVSAMTRTLIESYILVKILKKEQSQQLLDEWWLCNLIHKIKDNPDINSERLTRAIKDYCKIRNISFEEKWEYYAKTARGEKGWLKELMGKQGIGVRALCEYIGESQIYEDYADASSYVHGQDIMTKFAPFTFYISIYNKLHTMTHYIFKSIRLFGVEEAMEERMQELEEELLVLGEEYIE